MGIFNVAGFSSIKEDANVELPLDVEVIEKDDVEYASEVPAENEDPLAVAGEIAAQTESNWNEMMRAIGMHELRYLKEHGTEIVYEAADMKEFKKKVVEFFDRLKKKIWAVVKNFIAKLQSKLLKGSKFVSKYRDEIKDGFAKLQKSDKTIKVYMFNESTENWNADAAWKRMGGETYVNAISDIDTEKAFRYQSAFGDEIPKSRDLSFLRAKSLSDNDTIKDSDFDKMVFEYFYGSSEKVEKKFNQIGSIDKYIKVVNGSKGSIKTAKESFKKIEKKCNDAIKAAQKIKEFKTEDGNNASYMNRLQVAIQDAKNSINVLNKVYSGQLSALRAEYAQARSICLACIQDNNKVDKKLFDFKESSFLSNVQFV